MINKPVWDNKNPPEASGACIYTVYYIYYTILYYTALYYTILYYTTQYNVYIKYTVI
jgi:hypothetical protein